MYKNKNPIFLNNFFLDFGTFFLYITILGILIYYFRIYTEKLTNSIPDIITGIMFLIIISWSSGIITLIVYETYIKKIKELINNEEKN